MTVTMDHKNSRKSSWDSKMSVSTVSSATRQYRRSASSIISSDSDIRFTRKKFGSNIRCGCCITATLLLFLLLTAAALYVAYTFFKPDPPEEQTFRAMFRVIEGDSFTPEMADPSTDNFRTRAMDYRSRLNTLFKTSDYRDKFVDTEILALDGIEGKDLIVHFNVRMDPGFSNIEASDLEMTLARALFENSIFTNLTIDSKSLDVQKNYSGTTTTTQTTPTNPPTPIQTTIPPPPRKCQPIGLKYCNSLPYNHTSYPNILGHKSQKEVEEDMIVFRELVDAECYRLAYDFVCQLLQPGCKWANPEDLMVLPCRSYCREFMAGCGSRLQPELKEKLDCNVFPEFSGFGYCQPKPDCVPEMQRRGLTTRICDGVIDCQDVSDEKSCNYCAAGYLHCGIGRACIPPQHRCDGKVDCPDGSDERACLTISPSLVNVTRQHKHVSPHQGVYHAGGYVVFNEKGQTGKLCAENVNNSMFPNKTDMVLQTVAGSLCNTLSYQKVSTVKIKRDEESNIPYVRMKDPTASEITFIRTMCPTKKVLHVECADLECGLQTVHGQNGVQILNKMAGHGDWPWHAALFKEDVHVCDGTLVSPDWLVTTASCFQGQPKAEWTARVGTVRLAGTSPWQQERRIIGLVKSPVEGSTIAMVKLEEPVHMSDFVRPVCLPKEKSNILSSNMSYCNTLGWARNREQLQRVQLKISEMEKCENVSIKTVNSICTESAFSKEDCNEEELAGSSMLCLLPDGIRWSLVGVSNWRIACSKNAQRPRMYDKITSNVDWIHQTISAIS